MDIIKVIGVYHADRGFRGHLRYVFDKVARGEGCALCDISHGTIREKAAFAACKQDLGIPMEMRYRDELSPALAAVVSGRTPAVVGLSSTGAHRLLLGPEALDAVQGEVYGFRAALEAALSAPAAED